MLAFSHEGLKDPTTVKTPWRVLSYPSPSRSVRAGSRGPWERGWAGSRKRRLSSFPFPCSFALLHQSLACYSRFALASPRKTRRLRRRQRKKCSEPFLLGLTTVFSISGKFFWTTDSSLQSSGCKNLNHWAVLGVRNRTISSCLAELINTGIDQESRICEDRSKMSLKDCVLKKVFKEVLQAAFIAAFTPPGPPPFKKTFIVLHFCALLWNLPLIVYDQSHILFRRLKKCLQKSKNNQ